MPTLSSNQTQKRANRTRKGSKKMDKKITTILTYIGIGLVVGVVLALILIKIFNAQATQITMGPFTFTLPTPAQTATPTSSLPPTILSPAQSTNNPSPAPTPTPEIGQDFKINCISHDLWIPYHGEQHSADSRNCWELDDWYFFSKDSGLLTSLNPTGDTEHAIYALLMGKNAKIDFELNISMLQASSKDRPAIIEFGITPSMSAAYSNYYGQSIPGQHLFILGSPSQKYYYSIGQTYGGIGTIIDYVPFPTYSSDHKITIRLDVPTITFFLDGNQIAAPSYTPTGNSYFRIGYEASSKSTIETSIYDLTIEYYP